MADSRVAARAGALPAAHAAAHAAAAAAGVALTAAMTSEAVKNRLLTNDDGAIADAFRELVSEFERVTVAVAFAKQGGLPEVATLERGGRAVRFLAGTDFQQTEIELLDRLAAAPGCETRAFLGAKLLGARGARTFHPRDRRAGDRLHRAGTQARREACQVTSGLRERQHPEPLLAVHVAVGAVVRFEPAGSPG